MRAATSARSAAASCPRRWSRRFRRSRRSIFARAQDPAFAAELSRLLTHYVGRADAAVGRAAAAPALRRRAHSAQARGPDPHRRAQDQQRARPGAARRAHGQEAHRRGDRRRAARRRQRHGVRAARPRVRRLHGRRGHGAPGAQRLSHAAARRRGAQRRRRQPDAQGRDQRGDARLGGASGRHALPARAPRSGRIRIR